MADYFDTIIIPRIKKVAYSLEWKNGNPQDTDGPGVLLKYHYLEQYEDTLDNLELKENQSAKELFKEDYLIKYFIDFETREDNHLLNVFNLSDPFSYKIKINKYNEQNKTEEVAVDIPETFNYLIGAKVKRILSRKYEQNKYLFVIAEKENKKILIVWRKRPQDPQQDSEIIEKIIRETDFIPDIIYIEGYSTLSGDFDDFKAEIRYIEPEFKKLMMGHWDA